MKTLKLSGEMSMEQVRFREDLTFCKWLVNSNSWLGKDIKPFQNQGDLKDVFLELDGKLLPYKISDFNHIGTLVKALYKMEQRNSWLGLINHVKVIDTPYVNTIILEETQYNNNFILASDLLTQFEDYELGLKTGRDNCFILAYPKFKKYDFEFTCVARKVCDKYPYDYKNLLAFIAYLSWRKWFGDTGSAKGTCSEFEAGLQKVMVTEWKNEMGNDPADNAMYALYLKFLDKPYEIAPVHNLTIPDLFYYYLIRS